MGHPGVRLAQRCATRQNHGNVTRTAEVLGLERSHLYRKMKALGVAANE
jgi:DNA-binding NtrC family response regulator